MSWLGRRTVEEGGLVGRRDWVGRMKSTGGEAGLESTGRLGKKERGLQRKTDWENDVERKV